MREFKITLLPSQKNDFRKDEELKKWAKELTDSEPYLKIVIPKDEKEAKKELLDSEAAYGVLTEDLLLSANKIEWLQAPQAAPPSNFYYQEMIDHPLVVTNFRGIYNDHISHHIMSMVLSFSRSLNKYINQQSKQLWEPINDPIGSTRYLPESTVLIIGVGGIGEETGLLCSRFGMKVIGIDSRKDEKPIFFSSLERSNRILDYAATADFVISTVPHTPETEGLFNLKFFQKMKKSAFFINIGRGKTTILKDLNVALDEKEISGAGLDVFEIEPLPPDNPLWKRDNVILTPHVAAYDVPYISDRRFGIIKKNIRLFSKNKDLINIVDKKLWF
jgi:phosphoglycerate dehydrogenase-like enzyme